MPQITTTDAEVKVVYDYNGTTMEGWSGFSEHERRALNAIGRQIRAMRNVVKAPGKMSLNFDRNGVLVSWNLSGGFMD